MDGVHPSPGDPPMPPLSLPALQSGSPTAWEEAVYAFLVEKRARSGSTRTVESLSLIHISEPTRLGMISYAVFCLKKKKMRINKGNHFLTKITAFIIVHTEALMQ